MKEERRVTLKKRWKSEEKNRLERRKVRKEKEKEREIWKKRRK